MRNINITYSNKRLDALAAHTRERVQAAAGVVEEKTESFRAHSRLEREIADLREEIRLQMQAIGEAMYATHRGDPPDSGYIQQILDYVDSLYEQIDAHRQELAASQGARICSACGAANNRTYTYCHNCGRLLRN